MQILDNIGPLSFISWAISLKLSDYYFFDPFTDVPSFVEKYPKIKYAVSDSGSRTFVKHLFYD
jgi:hypothetical protein